MGTGLELRLSEWRDTSGDELRDKRRGVSGGVEPLPLARLSPIALTSSLTETPTSSGGMSLLKHHIVHDKIMNARTKIMQTERYARPSQ